MQDAGGSSQPVSLRNYLIRGSDGARYPAYVAVFSAGLLGQYYDEGHDADRRTDVRQPRSDRHRRRENLLAVLLRPDLMIVAWHAHGAVYWVHNTLTDAVGNGELLAIAEQTQPIGTPGTPGSPIGGNRAAGPARLKNLVVPTRSGGTATTTSLVATIGSIGGLLTLIALPLFCTALLLRRRGLSELRGRLHATMCLTEQLSAATVDHTGTPPGAAGPSPVTYTKDTSSISSTRGLPRLRRRVPSDSDREQ